jgi:hypothetical protein
MKLTKSIKFRKFLRNLMREKGGKMNIQDENIKRDFKDCLQQSKIKFAFSLCRSQFLALKSISLKLVHSINKTISFSASSYLTLIELNCE